MTPIKVFGIKKYLIITILLLAICFQIHAQRMDSIKNVLESHFINSIKQRNRVKTTLGKYGPGSKEFSILNKEIQQSDSMISLQVIAIITKYGWLGKDVVGETANEELFLAIQHTNVATMEKYYDLLEASAKSGKSNKEDMAKMKDRILVLKHLPQIYGTQYYWDATLNSFAFHTLENPELIDKKRKAVGLSRLKKYAKENNIRLND